MLDIAKRIWYIVEAEISRHSVWSHIAPQVAKQIFAASNPISKQGLVDLAADKVRNDIELQERFNEEGIHQAFKSITDQRCRRTASKAV